MTFKPRILAACSCLFTAASLAQTPDHTSDAPLAQRELAWNYFSPSLALPGSPESAAVVASTLVKVPAAAWLRLSFAGTTLGGDPAAEGATLRLTSIRDGGVQLLNSESLAQSGFVSVYFNGDQVLVELIARGGVAPSTLKIASVFASDPDPAQIATICGPLDNRARSFDPRNARMMTVGCTAWLIGDPNRSFLSAGHCTPGTSPVMQFNVPLSTSGGGLVNPGPQDQYPADSVSSQRASGVVGGDWQYIGAFTNSTTGLTAYQAQGSFYALANAPAASGQQIRITGYGTVNSPVSLTFNQVQKTHLGVYVSLSGTSVRYATDTTGGNSGSPVVLESTGAAVGIHTHGGCTPTGGSNAGTAFQIPALQAALAAPRGVSRSGVGSTGGDLFVIGDAANNFGTVSVTNGAFASISAPGVFYQGLAYNPAAANFYAINTARLLQTINPATGAATNLGTVTGTTLTISALAFDPAGTGTLYAFTPSNGQLLRIDPVSLVATPLGTPSVRAIASMDFDASTGNLYAIEDHVSGSRLIRLIPSTGFSAIVGSLGAGITDCNALAVDGAAGRIFTINAATDALLEINPASGVATVRGPTNGLFGAQYGMAFRYVPSCSADFNSDGVVNFFDYLDFVDALSNNNAAADFNSDGMVDFFDYLDFVNAFGAGC